MLLEWFFLMSVLSGPFDPSTELGWRDMTRTRHASPTLALCEAERDAVERRYRKHPVIGGAVVITGCQPQHVDW